MIKDLINIFKLISFNFHSVSSLLVVVSLITSFFEVISIISIVPFLYIVQDPTNFENFKLFQFFFEHFNFFQATSILNFMLFIIICVFSLSLLLNMTLKFLIIFISNRLYAHLSSRLFQEYLHKKIYFYITNKSSDLIRNIIDETSRTMNGIYQSFINILTQSLICFFLVWILVFSSNISRIYIVIFLIIFYFIIILFIRKYAQEKGLQQSNLISERYKILNDSISFIKEINIYGLKNFFFENYKKNTFLSTNISSYMQFLNILPRAIIDFMGIVFIVSFIYISIHINNINFENTITKLSLVIFAAYKLIPAAQNIYSSIIKILNNSNALKNTIKFLDNSYTNRTSENEKFLVSQYIRFNKINFKYDNTFILQNLDFQIKKHDKIFITGASGSGKSTFLDLITGFISPTSGQIVIDGKNISYRNYEKFMKNFNLISQYNFYLNDSIKQNITLSGQSAINYEKLNLILQSLYISDFLKETKRNIDDSMNEKGLSFSGGQKQRISIARALYNDKEFLFFDESTSALDEDLEAQIVEYLVSLKNKTIIFVSHNKSLSNFFDKSYLFKNGSLEPLIV